ncbi:hypothetical protein DFH11DRAFT_101504 [Phellopilus nigrolimitatus]|nr:hypothetical protein DFH11DRAFT_101504 [Phellopilus nigrolimitatus]
MRSFGFISLITAFVLSASSGALALPGFANEPFSREFNAVSGNQMTARGVATSAPKFALAVVQNLTVQLIPNVEALSEAASANNITAAFLLQQSNEISSYMRFAATQLQNFKNSSTASATARDNGVEPYDSSGIITAVLKIVTDVLTLVSDCVALITALNSRDLSVALGQPKTGDLGPAFSDLLDSLLSLGIPGVSMALLTNNQTPKVVALATRAGFLSS